MESKDWTKTVSPPVRTTPKESVHLRVDPDILSWFRRQDQYQALINNVLRAYMEAHQGKKK